MRRRELLLAAAAVLVLPTASLAIPSPERPVEVSYKDFTSGFVLALAKLYVDSDGMSHRGALVRSVNLIAAMCHFEYKARSRLIVTDPAHVHELREAFESFDSVVGPDGGVIAERAL